MDYLDSKIATDLLRGDATAELFAPAYRYYPVGKVPSVPLLVKEGQCQWCGKDVFNKALFCSDECEREYKSCLPKKVKLKDSIRYRDVFTCQQCGFSVAKKNEYGMKIPRGGEIHHKVFVKDGGTTTPENLILLCHKCHNEYHKNDDFELLLKEHTYTEKDIQLLRPIKDFSVSFDILSCLNAVEFTFPFVFELYEENINDDFDYYCPFENIFQSYVAWRIQWLFADLPCFLTYLKEFSFKVDDFPERVNEAFCEAYKPLLKRIWSIKNASQTENLLRLMQKKRFDLGLWFVKNANACLPSANRDDFIGFLTEQLETEPVSYDDEKKSYKQQMKSFLEFCLGLLNDGKVVMQEQSGTKKTWKLKKKNKPKKMNGNKYL